MSNSYAKLSRELKGKCVDYAVNSLMADFLVSNAGKLFTEKHENKDGVIVGEKEKIDNDWIANMDNFLLFGKTADDKKVLSLILKEIKGLSAEEKEILADWQKKAFNSIFEIIDIDENKLKLFDVAAEVEYDVYSNNDESLLELFPEITKRNFIHTNIIPIKNFWFLSGAQQIFSAEMEQNIFDNFVQKQSSQNIYRNNPEKLKKAMKLQKEIYDFFIEYYTSDEIIVPGKMLAEKQQEFYNAWNNRLGGKESLPREVFSKDFEKSDSVGIVVDPVKGEYFFIDYGQFVKVFAEPDKKQRWRRKIVLGYLEDESLPRFVFERVKNKYPDGFRKVMKELVKVKLKKDFDPVNDFNMLMEKYKPIEDDPYPSIQPMNMRFKKYYYQKKDKVGRNDLCYCGSKKKYKKCCGR